MPAIAANFPTDSGSVILGTHTRSDRVDGAEQEFRVLLVSDPDGYLIRLSERIENIR